MRLPIATGAVLAVSAAAQLPTLHVPAAVPLLPSGTPAAAVLTATPGRAYAVLVDLSGGPRHVLGERLHLGLTPQLLTLAAGTTLGVDTDAFVVPPALPAGLPLYLQAVVLDPVAIGQGTGLFDPSNGESLIPFSTADSVIVERFDDPVAAGMTGGFDRAVFGRLQGAPVRRRAWVTDDPQGALFGQPIQTPLNPYGLRSQMVYRSVDLGATGEPELVVAVRWKPFGPVTADQFGHLEIRMTHTDVTPDYTIDPFTALPKFPNSGLDVTFQRNYRANEPVVTVYTGGYVIDPRDLRPDGFIDYPITRPFEYDGTSSLLLEFLVPPSTASGINGQSLDLMVLSSPNPFARVVAGGAPGTLVDPNTVTRGRGDNGMHIYQFEFLRVKSTAGSAWIHSKPGANYSTPYVARTVPAGTSVVLEYRGAADANGAFATAWSTNVDIADGKEFVQYRARFTANPTSNEVASIDTLVIPYR